MHGCRDPNNSAILHLFLLALAGLSVSACTAAADPEPVACGPLDATLRLNQIQALGTHNSYHVAKAKPLDPSLAYSHPPLAEQLAQQGIRHFELDLHKRPGEPFQVFHLPAPDGWVVTLPGGKPSRCHPLTAPAGCLPSAVEALP